MLWDQFPSLDITLIYSTFPLQVVDERLSSILPYCMFVHYCVTLLNGTLIDLKVNEKKESTLARDVDIRSLLEHTVPAPIAEYFSLITTTMSLADPTDRFDSQSSMNMVPRYSNDKRSNKFDFHRSPIQTPLMITVLPIVSGS
ncbi:hypothetical protein WN55_11383 [Dufourea novaeangliae]|uniref:Uncharacterized protein n=1 Tax=Dufourea novaeangliae TaxID=178035 RepID=A0A154PCF4_DUFNO|nr:hypothetical protein WN55_11383 [Dufourea novaeangliae]